MYLVILLDSCWFLQTKEKTGTAEFQTRSARLLGNSSKVGLLRGSASHEREWFYPAARWLNCTDFLQQN
jgi:hypothetical protein